MEALLLTLDVACMVILLRNVSRVSKSGNEEDFGFLGYDLPKNGSNSSSKK